MNERPTLIEFVDKYTREFASHVFLREKVDGTWTETTFDQTRKEGLRIAAGLMSMGIRKGDKVSLLSEGRNMWILAELGILYAGGVSVPLSIKLEESNDLTFRIRHSESRFVIVSGQQLPKIRRIAAQLPEVEKIIVLDPQPSYETREVPMEWVQAVGDSFLFGNRLARLRPTKRVVVELGGDIGDNADAGARPPTVQAALKALHDKGDYPESLD